MNGEDEKTLEQLLEEERIRGILDVHKLLGMMAVEIDALKARLARIERHGSRVHFL